MGYARLLLFYRHVFIACFLRSKNARRFATLAFLASYLVFRLRLNIRLNMPCFVF
jgi:hypothetical protein